MAKTNDALKILDRMISDDADLCQMIAEETLKAQIARLIYEARTAAGLTQQALAARVGMQPSVIARLEDADMDSVLCSCCTALRRPWGLHWTFV